VEEEVHYDCGSRRKWGCATDARRASWTESWTVVTATPNRPQEVTMLTTIAATAPYWHGGGFPFPVFPAFFFVAFLVVFLVFGVLRRGSWRARSDARSVLADRFARGDIDAEEYRSRLSELSRK